MVGVIQVSIEKETAAGFVHSLIRNLDQAEAARVLEWTRDHEDSFHTRIHHGQATVVLHTAVEDGERRFGSFIIQTVTHPPEPDDADYLVAMIGRDELGASAALADDLVARLAQSVSPEGNLIFRILNQFIGENKL